MKFNILPLDLKALDKTAVVFAHEGAKAGEHAKGLDKGAGGAIADGLKTSRFTGEVGNTMALRGLPGKVSRIVLAGLGNPAKATLNDLRKAGIHAGKALDSMGVETATVVLDDAKLKLETVAAARAFMEGLELALYRFDRFKTDLKPHQKEKLKTLTVMVEKGAVAGLKKAVSAHQAQTEGANLARDLVNLPPNIADPQYMVQEAKKLEKLGLEVKIFGRKELEKLGFGLMLAVGQGSAKEQQMIVMRWKGGNAKDPYKAIIGKGVMFDTGGYDLKPSSAMTHMKGDMAGAAAVMGAMKALAGMKAKVNVIGAVGCVENMVSSNAFLPSAILTGYSGKTVEIGNTDAEGRLVLADVMSYIIDKEKPTEVIDLATLTGACMVALGGHYAGLFTNTDRMATGLTKSGEATGERVWRLPIDKEYAAKTELADYNNDGSRWGGASTAAVFLSHFVGKTPWAHLDIAGVALGEKIPGVTPLNGANGFGVRLLVDYLTGGK